MRHQVFLFLSLYFCFVHSMNHDTSKITKEQIVSHLTQYNTLMKECFSHCFNVQGFDTAIENIKNRDLSENDKKEILAEMKLLPAPLQLGKKYILMEPLNEALK